MKSPLEKIIRDRILHSGSISFHDFMAACLYEETYGYYTSGKDRVGKEGDFYTSVSVSNLFAELLCRQFYQMWEQMEKPVEFFLVEQGANDGRLAEDILLFCQQKFPNFFSSLSYLIIEPFARLQQKQEKRLGEFKEKVKWVSSTKEIAEESVVGIFFSNELIDSFPVHLLHFQSDCWQERFVGWNEERREREGRKEGEERFFFVDKKVSNRELQAEIERWNLPRVEGYQTEVNLEAIQWVAQVDRLLKRGIILTIDYGFLAEVLYEENRKQGTLTCFHQHRRSFDPLVEVGEQDLTTHINFSLLYEEGKKRGWDLLGLTDQHHFFIGVAEMGYLEEMESRIMGRGGEEKNAQDEVKAFQTLTHPEWLGVTFKFLIQGKGVAIEKGKLAGLKYSSSVWSEKK